MNNKTKNIIVAIAVLIILGLFFGIGYYAHSKWNPCPVSDTTVVYVYDTVTHEIHDSIPYYKVDSVKYRDQAWMDSVIKANKVDTVKLLADYYAIHYYTRTWEDSLLTVSLKDAISENKPGENTFTYRILRPQQIVNNVVNEYNYSRYLYFGLDVPIRDVKYANVDLLYAFKRGYAGVGYSPKLNSISIKAGIKIAKGK